MCLDIEAIDYVKKESMENLCPAKFPRGLPAVYLNADS